MGLPFNIVNIYGFITHYVNIKFWACPMKKFRLCNIDRDQAQIALWCRCAYVHVHMCVCVCKTKKKKHGYLSCTRVRFFYAHFSRGCEKFFN
jgi:hypothetical protein